MKEWTLSEMPPITEEQLADITIDEDHILTVEDYLHCCEIGIFGSEDGFGITMKDGIETGVRVYPGDNYVFPEDITHVNWFNK